MAQGPLVFQAFQQILVAVNSLILYREQLACATVKSAGVLVLDSTRCACEPHVHAWCKANCTNAKANSKKTRAK